MFFIPGKHIIGGFLENKLNETSYTIWLYNRHVLLDYFTTRPSFKSLNVAFLTKWWQSWNWKIKNSAICHNSHFSSATRGRFSNVYTFLASMTTWSEKAAAFERLSFEHSFLENVKRLYCFLCFEFQLCHQGALFKCLHILSIYDHLVKKKLFKFLKDGLIVKWSSKTCQGVSF